MERFDELLAIYFESGLEGDELSELERLLEAEPGRREAFIEVARVHRMLGSEFGAMDEAEIARGVMAGIDRSETDLVASVMRGARRVKARVSRRRPRRTSWLPALVAAAGIAAVLVLLPRERDDVVREDVPSASQPASVAEVVTVEGTCVTVSSDGSTRDVAPGAVLTEGDRIETRRGNASVAYRDDGTRVDLGADSTITFVEAGGPKWIALGTGRLVAHVAPQRPDAAMTIVTSHAEARVVGTELALSTGADATRLEVNEGAVRLRRLADGASVDVAAGQFAVAAAGIELATRSVTKVFDDFEVGNEWTKTHWSDDCVFEVSADRAAGGAQCMRVAYRYHRPPAEGRGYSSLRRSVSLREGDTYLTLRLFVVETDRKTGINILLCQADESAWFMGYAQLRSFPAGEWVEFRVNIAAAQKKNNTKGGDVYDPREVRSCVWGVHGGSAVVYIDEFTLHAESAFTKGE